jgi:hypothetical protein
VIFVEWCPLAGAPPLAEALPRGVSVRVITVPADIATGRFKNANAIALWIFTAKNVGIRRARAPFVLATNPDVLYTGALFGSISKKALDANSFYRTSRYDVIGVPRDEEPRTQLRRAERSVIRVNLIGNSIRFDTPSGGRTVARAVKRYNISQAATAPETPEELAARPTEWLHTNASGDFFLMHRDRWKELRGYPEFASAGHLDSYVCVMAASADVQQVVIHGRKRLYHLEHERAINWERPQDSTLYHVPYARFLADAQTMLRAGAPTLYNDEQWGLGDVELPEMCLRL